MSKRLLIHTLTGQGIVNICQCHHLGRNRNLLPLKSVRITTSVITLMMPAANLICLLNQRLLLMHGQCLQHLGADQRMLLHNLKLFIGQTSGLIQHLPRYRYFSDIMQSRSRANQRNLRSWELILAVNVPQML